MSTQRRPPVSWADLLLYQSKPGAAQDAAEAARLLGLPPVELPHRAARAQKQPKPDKRKPPLPKPAVTTFRLPLRCPQGFAVQIEAAPQPTAEPLPLPDWGAEEAAEVERMLLPSGKRKPAARTLLDLGRIQARWRSALTQAGASSLDIDRMVQTLARNQWPQPLPQRTRPYRIQEVHVCIDLHPDRQHLVDDYLECWNALVASRPNARIHAHEIDGPGCWEPLLAAVGPGQVVLLLAEPRLMPGAELRLWRDMAVKFTRQGAVVRWSLDWSADAWSAHADAASTPSPAVSDTSLSLLLACLAPAVTVEPALVRSLIHALQLHGGLALEQAVWCHPDLDGALPYRQWYPERQQAHLQRLREASPAIVDTCGRVLWESHVHVHQVQRDQELLNWAEAATEVQVAQRCGESALHEARLRYGRVVQHLFQLSDRAGEVGPAFGSSPGVLRAAASERLQSLPDRLRRAQPQWEEMLCRVALTDARRGPTVPDDALAPVDLVLRQQGHRLMLVAADQVQGPGMTLAQMRIAGPWLSIEQAGRRRSIRDPRAMLQHGTAEVAAWGQVLPPEIKLRHSAGEVCLRRVDRPHWAAEFSQTPRGVSGLIHWPDGLPIWRNPAIAGGDVVLSTNGWRIEMDRNGPRLTYLFLRESSRKSARPVCFRYLPPGTYLQGSPQGIGHDDEHPQHPVTLSQSVWLAETPCTQALWQSVMGNNPSHFKKGADAPWRPVESVSWDDAQTFLKALKLLLPLGCEAVLPTESQWEYACRAGTHTAYWWGDAPDATKANFDITGERQIDDKTGTTPVDPYPPNPWGLYDMHGNVWEWCADGRRDYADSPERDPEGPGDGDVRVVRGGSWIDPPGRARAALRGWRPRRHGGRSFGFRFALRPPNGEARPGRSGASRRGGAAGDHTVGADALLGELPPEDFPPDNFPPEGPYDEDRP